MKSHSLLQFRPEGIYCPQGDFFIDPWRPVPKALITHGHADHARWGMEKYICQDISVPVLKSRISEDISVRGLAYGESLNIGGVKVSFHPAGHIPGSAQIRMEHKGFVSVVSGDYKLQDDGISTVFEPVRCNEFVTESTFGLPVYRWLAVEEINARMRDWALQNRAVGKTSVFIGYSLGKAQRIMKALEGAGTLHVHTSIDRLNRALASKGVAIPEYSVPNFQTDKKNLRGEIIILPPALRDSRLIRTLPDAAVALCSGWMQIRGSRRWRSADAGFAVSDHADWDALLRAVKDTEAEKIFVTHGQTEVFSRYLNETGHSGEVIPTFFGEEADEIADLEPSEKDTQ